MKSFKEFLEADMLGNEKDVGMKVVTSAGRNAAGDIAGNLVTAAGGVIGGAVGGSVAGPAGVALGAAAGGYIASVAKSIAAAVWSNRKNIKNRINDEPTLRKVKSNLSGTLTAKKFQETGKSIDELVSACVGVTDESQSYLSEQEIELTRNKILQASKEGNLSYGFAQEVVNRFLEEKINQIQNAIKTSPPQNWDRLMRSLNPRRRTG